MNDVPQIVEINEIIEETPTIKTFVFDWDMDKFGVPSPGEFVMVWNFHNEKPMSISLIDKENSRMAISVKNVGEFSSQLHDLKVGDKIGIRGSYGNGFSNDLTDKKVLAIGGGVGMAPINAIVSDLLKKGNAVDVVPAAVTKEELLFMEALEKISETEYLLDTLLSGTLEERVAVVVAHGKEVTAIEQRISDFITTDTTGIVRSNGYNGNGVDSRGNQRTTGNDTEGCCEKQSA